MASHAHGTDGPAPYRISAVVAASVLAVFGTSAMALFLVTQNWDWFAAALPTAAVGGLLFFHRSTGADAA